MSSELAKKPNRRAPCYCGSGKRYKNCHQRIDAASSALAAADISSESTKAVTIDLPKVGLPSSILYLAVEPSKDGAKTTLGPMPLGSPGEYAINIALQRVEQSPLKHGQTVMASLLEGTSYLGAPAVANGTFLGIQFSHPWPDGSITEVNVKTNADGFLSHLMIRDLTASSFDDADLKAQEVTSPLLSHLSLAYDVPVKVLQYDITEKRSGTIRTAVRIAPHFAVPSQGDLRLDTMSRGIASLYREGMNSASPTYGLLCFYKIVESLKHRRTRVAVLCNDAGLEPVRFDRTVIPNSNQELLILLSQAFPAVAIWDEVTQHQVVPDEVRGLKLLRAVDRFLTPLRNKVAHALLDSGELADIDDPRLLRDIVRWIPFSRFAARTMVVKDLAQPIPASVADKFEEALSAHSLRSVLIRETTASA
jgi:hypothetical protein